jgi:hypothetical protein
VQATGEAICWNCFLKSTPAPTSPGEDRLLAMVGAELPAVLDDAVERGRLAIGPWRPAGNR